MDVTHKLGLDPHFSGTYMYIYHIYRSYNATSGRSRCRSISESKP